MEQVSAYIPAYNCAATLQQAIQSVQRQSSAVDDILVVDDGSLDDSANIARAMGIKVVSHEINLGRGATRARAMSEARHDLVLCCDSNKILSDDFVAKALPHMEDSRCAAVCGRISLDSSLNLCQRWSARHIYRVGTSHGVEHRAPLVSAGAIVRKSLVLACGNYNKQLRHSEDRDLGDRLLSAGHEIISDPQCRITMIGKLALSDALERYWRWNAGVQEEMDIYMYLKVVAYAAKVMALQDLQAGDPLSVLLSLLAPHYQFWQSWRHRRKFD